MLGLWSGTIQDLKYLIKCGTLTKLLKERFINLYGQPSPGEEVAWKNSIPALVEVLADKMFDPIQVILELQMPVGSERADVILLGGQQANKKAFVIELKQWTRVTLDPDTTCIIVPGLGSHQHPSKQALNYVGKLHCFHPVAADYDFRAAVFLHNMSQESKEALLCEQQILDKAPLFTGNEFAALADAIRDHLLSVHLAPDEHEHFRQAFYEQTRHLHKVLEDCGDAIASGATAILAEQGIGLTGEQELLAQKILAAAHKQTGQVFLTKGGSGSGKTLLAVMILLQALREGLSCALAVRNNRLHAILRECFDSAYRGASGALMFFEVPYKGGRGIANRNFKGTFDLVICDEAQRMRAASMSTILNRAPVCAVFLDEAQRLNPREEGTISAFLNACAIASKEPVQGELSAALRCRGGKAYHDWVDVLLGRAGSHSTEFSKQIWYREHTYRFKVYESIQELIYELKTLSGINNCQHVALVASFTESPGNPKKSNHVDNIRIGYPLTSRWEFYKSSGLLPIRWLMKPQEYVQFWMRGKSNNLDRVASIYGAQGLESDYVGVIWGRDLIMRDGQWVLGDPEHCYDSIDGLVSRGGKRRWANGALELVKNRYRIFLTRGIKGTLVFCEDNETREYLLSLGHLPDEF